MFGLLCGAVVAAFASGIAFQLLGDTTRTAPPQVSTPAAAVTPVESRTAVDPLELARKLEGANDLALAQALDAADFDKSWTSVKAVGRALRSRPSAKIDPLTGLSESAVIGPRAKPVPLLALEQEIARRQLVLDIRSRDNAATRLLDKASDEESVRKLVDLFSADARPPEFERVREDAALVLAFGATERGREVLGRTIRDASGGAAGATRERATLAARALGLSDDEKAFALLSDLLANDREPEARKLGAYGLSFSSALARGNTEVVAALVRAARSDSETAVRTAALVALGDADLGRAPGARAVLVEVLASPSETEALRLEAIASIRSARSRTKWTQPELVEGLLQTLNTERDGPVRKAIAAALGECAPAAKLADLETALGTAQDPAVREALAKAIAEVKARGEPPP